MAEDSLDDSVRWAKHVGLLWLNPPFAAIAPWAKKARDSARKGARIAMLTPASVGANWFDEFVHREALVLALSPRLSFDGKNSYPKDCILSIFSHNESPGFDTWRWDTL
jgi:hypothetical protein